MPAPMRAPVLITPIVALMLPPGTPARAAPDGSARPIVAVFEIELSGVVLGRGPRQGLDDYLYNKIAGLGRFKLVPRSQLRSRLRAQKRESYNACYDQSCQIEIGKELAAQKSFSSKIIRLGGKCLVTMALFDLRSATTEQAADASGGCGVSELIRSIERAALKFGGAPPGATPVVRAGTVDKKYCPLPDTRRVGEPHPAGRSVSCINGKGQLHGTMIAWHTNGKVASRMTYREGKAEGPHEIFHRNGSIFERGNQHAGRRVGRWTRYYDGGQKMEQGEYRAGQRRGPWISWRPDGKKDSESTYRDDDRDGPSTSFHANGRPRERGQYRAGKKHGRWIVHRTGGGKAEEQSYAAGQLHGVVRRFHRDGWLQEEVAYRRGKRHGATRRWRMRDGQRRLDDITEFVENDRRKWVRYDPDGNVLRIYHYRDGQPHGLHVNYCQGREGRYKCEEGHFVKGKKQGRWTRFAPDGSVRERSEYADGNKR